MAPTSQPSSRDGQIIETLMQHERPREIIRRLYKHLDDILQTDKLQIVINCKGKSVKLHRTLHDD